MRNNFFRQDFFYRINCNFYNSRMNIRKIYMIIRSIKLVQKRMYLQRKSIISARLWRLRGQNLSNKRFLE